LKAIEGPGPDIPGEGPVGDAHLQPGVTRLALAITRKCQARCVHCAGGAGPHGGHGSMTRGEQGRGLNAAAQASTETATAAAAALGQREAPAKS
jgi:hypothetical protein